MASQSSGTTGSAATPLVAIRLPRIEAAAAVAQAWQRGEAVAVLDPAAPPAVLERLLGVVRPTHLLDDTGRRPWSGGAPVDDDVVAVVVTSGTTGDPKAVELTGTGRAAHAAGYAEFLELGPDERWLCCGPLHHASAFSILGRVYAGITECIVHPEFDVAAVAAAPRTQGATIVSLVPTMLQRLLDAEVPLHEYRHVLVGGAPVTPALRARAERIGAPIVETYGQTEVWAAIAMEGIALRDALVRLAPDHEVLVRGPYLMRGYRGRPDRTAAAIDVDGFLHTGDLGAMDDGRLRILGRIDDLVITGGVNVSPTAIEAVLVEHPEIDDVCVTGAPDPEWGERVVAFVVPHDPTSPPTLDGLWSFAREHLAAPQLPRELVLVTSIPRTPSGKIMRRELRADLNTR